MRTIAVILLVCFPAHALADELKYMPKWRMVGNEACFDFEGAKTLMRLDSELVACSETTPIYARIVEDLRLSIDDIQKAMALSRESEKLLLDQNKRLETDLKAAITRANKAEANSGPSMGWLVAGASLVFVGGVLLGVYLVPRK